MRPPPVIGIDGLNRVDIGAFGEAPGRKMVKGQRRDAAIEMTEIRVYTPTASEPLHWTLARLHACSRRLLR
jgi:hypothetical protein